jgi:hypothetical protein
MNQTLVDTDKNGNTILAELIAFDTYAMYLKLLSEGRARHLGNIDTRAKVMFVERDRQKHLYRKTQSYGFNEYVLRNGDFNTVVLTDDFGKYVIPKDTIFQYGNYLNHKRSGFELQIFLRLELINKYKK